MITTRIRLPARRKSVERIPTPVEPADIVERDDGWFEILPFGSGPFPTRSFAHSVWLEQRTRH